jgi:hypothetical protein
LNASLLEVKNSVSQIEVLANSDGPDIDPATLAALANTVSADKPKETASQGQREKSLESILEKILVRILSRPNVIQEVWDDSLLDDLREVFDDDYLQELLESAPSENEDESDHGSQQQSDDEGSVQSNDSQTHQKGTTARHSTAQAVPSHTGKRSNPHLPEDKTRNSSNTEQGGEGSEEMHEQDIDEWENDDDVGFVWMSVTEEEFFQIQEVCVCVCVCV